MAVHPPPAPRRRHGAPAKVTAATAEQPQAAASSRRRRRGVLGWWSSMAFNAALFALPLCFLVLAAAMEGVQLARYEPTPPALASAKSNIEQRLRDLTPRDVPREQALSFLVGRETTEGDAEAARGFLMAAGAILPGAQVTRLYQSLRAGSSEEDLASTAARFLEPTIADGYLRIQSGRAQSGGAFYLLGDTRELAQAARRWLEAGDSDGGSLILSGLSVIDFGLPADAATSVRVGASVLKSARAAGRLSPESSAALAVMVERAFPSEALRTELRRALAAPEALADEGAAAAQALRGVRYDPAFRAMIAPLAAVRGIAAATSPSGALRLIAHARTPADFEPLSLLAQAGRERAVALAKRTTVEANLAALAPVTWRIPPVVLYAAAALVACVFGLLIATVFVLKHALERAVNTQPTGAVTALAPRIGLARALPRPQRSDAEAAL